MAQLLQFLWRFANEVQGEKKKALLNSALPKFKAILFINTMKVQIRSSNLHCVSKTDFEIKDCMRLQAISEGNTH